MNTPLTARQLDRLRKLPPDHKLISVRDGSPIFERSHGRQRRVEPNGSVALAPPRQEGAILPARR